MESLVVEHAQQSLHSRERMGSVPTVLLERIHGELYLDYKLPHIMVANYVG
jgi:hypothetical protein